MPAQHSEKEAHEKEALSDEEESPALANIEETSEIETVRPKKEGDEGDPDRHLDGIEEVPLHGVGTSLRVSSH